MQVGAQSVSVQPVRMRLLGDPVEVGPEGADRATDRVRASLWFAVRTLVLMAATGLVSVLAVRAGQTRHDLRGWGGVIGGMADGLTALSVLVALGAPLLLLMRRRDLENVVWGLGFLQFLFPLGPVMAMVLPQAVKDTKRQDAEALSFLYVLGLIVWFLRDAAGATPSASVLRLVTAPSSAAHDLPVELNIYAVALVFLGLAVAPISIGFYRRARHQLDDTIQDAALQREAAGQLSAQLTRQAERDLIAREVHDVIGHRLSLLSLHAGSVEVMARDDSDPDLRDSARMVRENAQQAMDDLRSLVGVLRGPEDGAPGALAPGPTSLADLARVVDETADCGAPVACSVFLSEADEASPVLAHSVYRIVQELLTNAHKHAPGQVLRLRVSGGPEQGVLIETSNATGGGPVRAPGNGLQGVRERAELLGGSVDLVAEEGRFAVRVVLPWSGRTR